VTFPSLDCLYIRKYAGRKTTWENEMTKSGGKILSVVLFFIAVLVLIRWFASLGGEEERSLIVALGESLFLVWAGLFLLKGNFTQ
jgi:hypothetical protein